MSKSLVNVLHDNWSHLVILCVVCAFVFFMIPAGLFRNVATTEPQKTTKQENLAEFAKSEPIATILNVENMCIATTILVKTIVTGEVNGLRFQLINTTTENNFCSLENQSRPIFLKGDRAKVKFDGQKLVLERIDEPALSP